MLELFLNLVWVFVVTASLLLWRRLCPASESRCHRPITALVALGCILVLLFPVISATDDLHVAEFAIEDSGRKVLRQIMPDAPSAANHSHSIFAAATPVFCLATPLFLTSALVSQPRHPFLTSSYRASVPNRAPPALV